MSNFVAVYDACILYPAPLRDLFMELALTDHFRARWTRDIMEEWLRNLREDRPDLDPERLERTVRLMNEHVRDALITGYESLIPSLDLPDPDDRHVLAAAIVGSASVIITRNVRDFPRGVLAPLGIDVQAPDDFLVHLVDLHELSVIRALKTQRARLHRPHMCPREFLDNLEQHGLPRFVLRMRDAIDLIYLSRFPSSLSIATSREESLPPYPNLRSAVTQADVIVSQPHKICPRCQTPAELQAPQCSSCGRQYRTQFPQNPDRTVLAGSEAPPAYPVDYQAPGYPQPYDAPAGGPPHLTNQQVHIHMSTPAPPPQAYPVYVPVSTTKTDPCAVLAMVFGVLGLVFFCLFGWAFGLVGVVLGIVSLVRIRQHPELDGAPLAIAGIGLSVIPLAAGIWLLMAMA